MTKMPNDFCLNAKEAADFLGISVDAVYRRLRAGKIQSQKFNRCIYISRSSILAYREAILSGRPIKPCLKASQ